MEPLPRGSAPVRWHTANQGIVQTPHFFACGSAHQGIWISLFIIVVYTLTNPRADRIPFSQRCVTCNDLVGSFHDLDVFSGNGTRGIMNGVICLYLE
jgi:hypothetical protein